MLSTPEWGDQMRTGEIRDRGVGGERGHMVTLAMNGKTHDSQISTLYYFYS